MWVEFVVGSRFAPRGFLRFSAFPSSTKTNTPNSNSTRIEDPHENQLSLMWLLLDVNIVIYLFIYLFVYLVIYLVSLFVKRWKDSKSNKTLSARRDIRDKNRAIRVIKITPIDIYFKLHHLSKFLHCYNIVPMYVPRQM